MERSDTGPTPGLSSLNSGGARNSGVSKPRGEDVVPHPVSGKLVAARPDAFEYLACSPRGLRSRGTLSVYGALRSYRPDCSVVVASRRDARSACSSKWRAAVKLPSMEGANRRPAVSVRHETSHLAGCPTSHGTPRRPSHGRSLFPYIRRDGGFLLVVPLRRCDVHGRR